MPDRPDLPAPRPGPQTRAVVDRHRALAGTARAVLDDVASARLRVAELVAADRDATVRAELSGIAVGRLAELTDKNLRLRALTDAGYRTALDLLDTSAADLERLPGVGRETARSALAAVDQLARAVAAGIRPRIDLDLPPRGVTRTAGPTGEARETWDSQVLAEILGLLHRLLLLGPRVEAHRTALEDYSSSVAALLPAAQRAAHRLRLALRRRRSRDASIDALRRLVEWEEWLTLTGLPVALAEIDALRRQAPPAHGELWADVERRSVEYYTVLGEIVPVPDAVLASHGMLPGELAERVAEHPLDLSVMRVALRGYQEFGARFVLNQGRVLLGDEMGLGKTVQAIAVMGDLVVRGERHLLVVCPASVLIGWVREVETRSTLAAHRLHGARRDEAIARWVAEGGVGVTTFEGLQHVPRPQVDGPWSVGLLVVDEAHYVKNPNAQRSTHVARWAESTWRVLFMTGTPMENRLEEFVTLVRMLQPEVADGVPRHAGLAGADAFRQVMAPVYLRRNQVDVLVELPELVVVDEWEELTPAGEAVYRAAVASGSLMAMRRAAFATPDPGDSTKLDRLLEIVQDAQENGHKVVVFSYFRDVIDTVVRAVGAQGPGSVHGPVTGAVPAEDRQQVIDGFTAAEPGAVLVAQVQAGGVGLNIQAASVVILCEPQLTPSAEAQAVGRVHRMGQLRTVVVHRLLVEGGVDEQITRLLGEKSRLFDAYVRESSLAAGAVGAVDVTQADLAREVVAAEQARLGYGPVWEALDG
ncbi:DEAD/DEAH box helicase [Actinotalea sp. K2]|uniref:DEAD/DEAH box helicase n=1 Tax=Actinotalea sp. K2 TaxID=2939438 RepID=UPI002017E219|nr:SNF2-related protein [Actinotalea sp. K2]MCL3860996.1 SNF2-related protein [Actinotalea sp. K2]